MSAINTYADGIFRSMGLDISTMRQTSLSFSLRLAPMSWKAHTFEAFFPVYRIDAKEAKINDIRNFVAGIRTDNYIVLAELSDITLFCISRAKKGELPLILPLRSTDDYERVINVLRRHNFSTDELSAHVVIDSCLDLLKSGTDKYFVNRGLFSSYFLRERLDNALKQRKREVGKESSSFASKFRDGIPSSYEEAPGVLNALGYSLVKNTELYEPRNKLGRINATAILVEEENMDVMVSHNRPVPSIQAVAALTKYPWVILTNGKIWRLYSSRVSSAGTNYFEIDIEGIADEKDPRFKYFISLFSSQALVPNQDGVNDLDFVYDGGLSYARDLENDLRSKVFEKQLFLDLVRGILSHSKSTKYSDDVLQGVKSKALKLLYRILFILYAESRYLLPINHTKYKEISFNSLRERLVGIPKVIISLN